MGQSETEDAALDPASHQRQLQNCREGILDPQARPEDRARWIDTLLAFNTSESREVVAELLRYRENPTPVIAVCEAIASQGRRRPERLDEALVVPLLELLDATDAGMRSAAARSLADFPSEEAVGRLTAIAADPDEPVAKRLTAMEALVHRVSRREVVRTLVTLLESSEPEIAERAAQTLAATTVEPFGNDLQRWRDWWTVRSQLSETGWLADQLEVYRERLRKERSAWQASRENLQRRLELAESRLRELQRENFRALPPDQRDAKLAQWLGDPVEEVKRTALAMIRGQIADEGRRPSVETLEALVVLLGHESPAIRREVLQIVQTLKDPAVVDAVLKRVPVETDPSVRQALFRALGRLESVAAADALVREIAGFSESPQTAAEAAQALAPIASKLEDPELRQEAVDVLRAAYDAAPPEDASSRTGLLSAMSGLGDPSFKEAFLQALDAPEPGLRRHGARGLAAIGDRSRLLRLREMVTDDDQLVRTAAIEALGILGQEEAEVEALLPRLDPANEPSELVRESAWAAFQSIHSRMPPAARLEAAVRLRHLPDREIRFLLDLLHGLGQTGNHRGLQEQAYLRLAQVLAEQDRPAEARPYLERLFDLVRDRPSEAGAVGRRWLSLSLQSNDIEGLPKALREVSSVSTTPEDQQAYMESVREGFLTVLRNDPPAARKLLEVLIKFPGLRGGTSWHELTTELERQLLERESQTEFP